MKFLQVIGSMNPRTGGPCQVVRNLAPWLDGQGNNMEIVCLDDPNSSYLSSERLQVHALGAGRGAWNYCPALKPWLKKHLPRFDAVILNGLWQYQSFALAKTARLKDAPAVFVFPHGMLDPWFQKMSVRPLKSMRNWVYWKLIERRMVNQADGLLFTCEEERRLARLPFKPYTPKQETVVGLGVPEPPAAHDRMKEAFAKRCHGAANRPYFLFLGRIHPKKGVELLIQGYAAICRYQAGADITHLPMLVIAGPGGETDYGQTMQRLAFENCPTGSVAWPGMLTGDAKWGALYNCEAFILPSHQENFGIAVVEALACGRPVLISNQVNIWREIESKGAAIVEPDTLAGTTALFKKWFNYSPAQRGTMAAQAGPCFQSNFSGEIAARNLLNAVTVSFKH